MGSKLILGILFCAWAVMALAEAPPRLREKRTALAAAVDARGRIYAIGGRQDGSVERFDPKVGRWEAVAALREPRYDHAAVTGKDGRLYVLGGGFTGGGRHGSLKSIEAYDPQKNTWTEAGALGQPREAIAAALAEDGSIVVIGGDAGPRSGQPAGLSLVERYWPDCEYTEPLESALTLRRRSAAAAVDRQGRIFVFGGELLGTWPGVHTVVGAERLDDRAWKPVSSMHVPRSRLAAATLPDGRIFVLGGYQPRVEGTPMVEIYDPKEDQWTPGPAMPTARFGHAAAVADGKLYVFGGTDRTWRPLDTMDVYDIAANRWE